MKGDIAEEAARAPLLQELFVEALLARVSSQCAWPADLASAIEAAGTLTVEQALDVHGHGYLARLTEQLGETYASVWRVLGDDGFFELCAAFVRENRSDTTNLSNYGRAFSAFLRARPETDEFAFLPELARFEWTFAELFHQAPHRSLDPDALRELGDLHGVRLKLGLAHRLFRSPHAVYDVFRRRREPGALNVGGVVGKAQRVLLFKQGDDVYARPIDPTTFFAIESLALGIPVDDVLATVEESDPAYGETGVAGLFELLVASGLLVGLVRGETAP